MYKKNSDHNHLDYNTDYARLKMIWNINLQTMKGYNTTQFLNM